MLLKICLKSLLQDGKLTPIECVIMDVSNEDIAKIKAIGISDSQMYKLLGIAS